MRAALAGFAAFVASVLLAAYARAQQYAPDTGPYPPGIQAPAPMPDPFAILEDDGGTFSVPIPGGGDIQVQGPASEPPHTMAPIENWAVRRNTPFSVGGAPIGPAPPQH